jgi:hypothetical protein
MLNPRLAGRARRLRIEAWDTYVHPARSMRAQGGVLVLEVCDPGREAWLERNRSQMHASFTQGRYGHPFPEADNDVADRLDALIG